MIEKPDIIGLRLKKVKNRIKAKNNFCRSDIQEAIDLIINDCQTYNKLKKTLQDMIKESGVKKIGIRTVYTPRDGLKEVDKTLEFIKDLRSYKGVEERFFSYGKNYKT